MRRTFLIWLLAIICTAFGVTVLLSCLQFSRHAQERASQVMSTRLRDLQELIQQAEKGMKHVVEINDNSMLERARALAEIIRLDPSVLQHQERLQGLCNELGADQLAVSDKKGILIAAVPSELRGFNLAQHEQSHEFMKCLQEPGTELCQRPRNNAVQNLPLQYAGVSRRDAPGVVQLGFQAQHERKVRASSSVDHLANGFQNEKSGHIIAFRNGAILNEEFLPYPTTDLLSLPLDETSTITLGDERYFAHAIEFDGYRLVNLMPVGEFFQMRALKAVLLWYILLFVVLFAALSYLLQRLVIRGISRLNDALRVISRGDLEHRVEVTDTPEFSRLSSGINAMVDTIQAYGEQRQEAINRELELARAIQTTALPSKFPAYPHRPEFDLFATCMQAKVIGGDFYDFFLTDQDHLSLLVADVSASGIPAALFMMRSMSIIRGLARASSSPVDLVTQTNRALCDGNTADLRMALFYGSLEISSGKLSFVNAGPPQALLQHQEGEYELIAMSCGKVLGLQEDAAYTECHLTLHPEERLFLYTDGVTKAANMDNTPFGAVRLQEALQGSAATASDVIRLVRSSLRDFTQEAEQTRDITMLALIYRGKKKSRRERSFPAGNPEEARDVVEEALEEVLAAPVAIADIQASVAGILAELPPESPVTLRLSCDEEEAEITLSYPQPLFNPLISLPHLPLDGTSFRSDEEEGCTLTLVKQLE